MENNAGVNATGFPLQESRLSFHDQDFENNNNSFIAPSLSDYELQKIKEELRMLDSETAGEFETSNFTPPRIYVDHTMVTPFDFPLTEQERALLEQCTIGSPRRFSETPSVCSTSLEQLADSLIKDLEDMDFEDETERNYFTNDFEISSRKNVRDLEASSISDGSELGDMINQKQSSKPLQTSDSQSIEDKSENFSEKVSSLSKAAPGNFLKGRRAEHESYNEDASSSSTDSKTDAVSEHTSRSLSLDSDSLPASIDSGLAIRDVIKTKHQYFVVVAIDFGTTFSGYAFAFTRDPESIHMMRRWEGGDPGVTNQKAPTTLLLKPDGTFHSFGFGARDFYHDLEPDDAKKWLYFEKFKMSLHTSKDLHKNVEIKAANGKSVRAVTVFAHALKFFKDHVLEELSDQSATRILEEDIQWVLTVPAIWRAPAKQFMRTAAYEAGLTSPNVPDRLLIALEPEAASIYCRKLRLRDCIWAEESRRRSTVSLPRMNTFVGDDFSDRTRYLVVDCGGGTVDLTVHELDTQTGTLQELHRGTGGASGASGVDEQFELLLKKIFGSDLIEQFKKKRPAGWVDLMIAFEAKKRTASPNKTNSLNISIPYSFIDYYKKHKSSSIESAVKKFGNPNVRWSSQGMLRIALETIKDLFQPVLEQILQHIANLIAKESVKGLSFLFLVGGFVESPLLQAAVRGAFECKMKVIIPQEVGLTILRGAVLFGIDPTVVRVRRAAMTYGVGVLNRFVYGKHPKNKLVKKSGIEWCTDVFDKFVEADQPMKLGESVTRSYAPAKLGKTSTVITIFSTEEENVFFITDRGVKKCGQLLLEMPEIHNLDPKKPRELRTSMIFGDTEIRVTAVDVMSGKEAKASIDFLSV